VRVDPYKVKGMQLDWLYSLVDWIFVPWSIFVKPL
jgi:hypothetical protein